MNTKRGYSMMVVATMAAVLFSLSTAAHSVRNTQPGCGSTFPVSLVGHDAKLTSVRVLSENMWARDNESQCTSDAVFSQGFFQDLNAVGQAEWKVIGGAKPMAKLEVTAVAEKDGEKLCYNGIGMTGILGEETVVTLTKVDCGLI